MGTFLPRLPSRRWLPVGWARAACGAGKQGHLLSQRILAANANPTPLATTLPGQNTRDFAGTTPALPWTEHQDLRPASEEGGLPTEKRLLWSRRMGKESPAA